MTFQSRVYVFGVTKEGLKEFIHTTLDKPSAKAFAQKHRQLFDHYAQYFYKTLAEDKEIYVD